MATLEVHDGRGRVSFVTVSRANPVVFGSDPKCDVLLVDPAALPFHGRLRWKNDHFKVEAFPEARALVVNGQRVVSSGFRPGDEISVGQCKLFLVSEQDGAADPEPIRRAATAAAAAPAGGGDWLAEAAEEAAPEPAPTRRGGRKPAAAAAAAATVARPSPSTGPKPKVPLWRQLFRKLNAGDLAPGQDRVLSSPLVLGLAVTLGTLLLVGYVLWNIVRDSQARKAYAVASQAYEDRDYAQALKLFDTYLTDFPSHPEHSKGKVLRALANVRQYASGNSVVAPAVVENARKMMEAVGKEPFFNDKRMDLGEDVLKAVGAFADQAKTKAEASALADAEAALKLHEELTTPAHKTLLDKSDVPRRLTDARAAVTKAQIRRDALAKMAEGLTAGKVDDVFAVRDGLVRQYPDLAEDKDLVARLNDANALIRKAVSLDPTTRAAETAAHPDPLGPPVSLVLRSTAPGAKPPAATADGPVVYAVAQGYAYGVDGATGAPLWHIPVGLSCPYPPLAVAGTKPTALVIDARYDELTRIDGRTGALIWRQSLGEPVSSPPLVLGNQVLQVLPSGKLVAIDLQSGAVRGTLDVGRPLAGTPAVDEAGQFFYLTGDRDSVYVVSRDPLECVAVEYLGQPAGSIKSAPARLANFLIVPENRDLNEGRWSVFVIEQSGEKLRLVQSVPVPGWTWETPSSQGTIVWSLTDRNAITAFAMGPEDSKAPLTRVAATVPDAKPSGPAYGRARGDREFWASGVRLGRFDLEAERGVMAPSWTIERAGQAVGPIQAAGRLAVLAHQFEEGPGVTLWGVDPASGKMTWKTVLGAPWPLTPAPGSEAGTLTTLATDGPEVTLGPDLLARGGFIEMPLRNPGYFHLPDGPLQRLERDGLTVLVPSPDADHLLVREGSTAEFRRVDLPAPLGAAPVYWGVDLFVPGLDGRAYLVDPKTGSARAEPYVPTFDADTPTRWRAPVFLASDGVVLTDSAGTVRRLERQTEPRVRLVAVGDPTELKSAVEADPVSTGDAVIIATADDKVRALAGRDLSPLGAWNLEVPRAYGPVPVGQHAFLVDKAGGLQAFGPDGSRIWAVDLGDAPPIGPPVVQGETLWLLSRDGAIQRRSLADGSHIDRHDLGILPGGGLMTQGDRVIVVAAPGTIRQLKPFDDADANAGAR